MFVSAASVLVLIGKAFVQYFWNPTKMLHYPHKNDSTKSSQILIFPEPLFHSLMNLRSSVGRNVQKKGRIFRIISQLHGQSVIKA